MLTKFLEIKLFVGGIWLLIVYCFFVMLEKKHVNTIQ